MNFRRVIYPTLLMGALSLSGCDKPLNGEISEGFSCKRDGFGKYTIFKENDYATLDPYLLKGCAEEISVSANFPGGRTTALKRLEECEKAVEKWSRTGDLK